jgi:hypothetical protein
MEIVEACSDTLTPPQSMQSRPNFREGITVFIRISKALQHLA